jgi:hypothetical protein
MLLASYLTRPTRVGNKPSQRLIPERSGVPLARRRRQFVLLPNKAQTAGSVL